MKYYSLMTLAMVAACGSKREIVPSTTLPSAPGAPVVNPCLITEPLPTGSISYVQDDLTTLRTGSDVLIIGDSVSQGYVPELSTLLAGVATVYRHDDNARYTTYTLDNMDYFLSEGNHYDTIIWNNGLHDIARDPSTGLICRTSPNQYAKNLRKIASVLLSKASRVVFVSTTNIKSTDLWADGSDGTEDLYNYVARTALKGSDVQFVDLNHVSYEAEPYMIDQIHYNSTGYHILAQFLVDTLF